MDHKNKIITIEENDSEEDVLIINKSKVSKAKSGKYFCSKYKIRAKLKKGDKKAPKKRKIRVQPNGEENGKKEDDIYALKNKNINDGFYNSGKTFSKTEENDDGEEFLKFSRLARSNNDKKDNFFCKKRKKEKGINCLFNLLGIKKI